MQYLLCTYDCRKVATVRCSKEVARNYIELKGEPNYKDFPSLHDIDFDDWLFWRLTGRKLNDWKATLSSLDNLVLLSEEEFDLGVVTRRPEVEVYEGKTVIWKDDCLCTRVFDTDDCTAQMYYNLLSKYAGITEPIVSLDGKMRVTIQQNIKSGDIGFVPLRFLRKGLYEYAFDNEDAAMSLIISEVFGVHIRNYEGDGLLNVFDKSTKVCPCVFGFKYSKTSIDTFNGITQLVNIIKQHRSVFELLSDLAQRSAWEGLLAKVKYPTEVARHGLMVYDNTAANLIYAMRKYNGEDIAPKSDLEVLKDALDDFSVFVWKAYCKRFRFTGNKDNEKDRLKQVLGLRQNASEYELTVEIAKMLLQ